MFRTASPLGVIASRATMIRIGTVVLAMGLATAACGGDDDPGGDAAPTTTVGDAASSTVAAESSTTSVPETTTTAAVDGDQGAVEPDGDSAEPDEGFGDELVFVAELSGDAVLPGPGVTGGSGRMEVVIAVAEEWCFDVEVRGVAGATGADIHAAAPDEVGEVVIDLGAPTTVEADTATWTGVCVDVDPGLVDQVFVDPARYYADVHSADFPDGAVRGFLALSSIFDLELS